jgi:molecular chaperone DnaK
VGDLEAAVACRKAEAGGRGPRGTRSQSSGGGGDSERRRHLAYQCEKQLKELGEKLSADQKKSIEKAVAKVRGKLKGDDADTIKEAMEELQIRFQSISAELYKQAAYQSKRGTQPGANAGGTTSSGRSGDEVIDADFEVDEDNKKKRGFN